MLKPVEVAPADDHEPMSPEELEEAVHSATDKERLVGLIAAPIAAAISFVVGAALVANDPAAHLKGGALNPHHVSVSLYHELELVLLALSVGILAFSMLRKRTLLGIVTALYGLALFNMHYWGFGIPFVMAGAWYLVRSYRLNRELKEATDEPSGYSPPVNAVAARPKPLPKKPSRPSRKSSARSGR